MARKDDELPDDLPWDPNEDDEEGDDAEVVTCPTCETPVHFDEVFCPNCGCNIRLATEREATEEDLEED